MNPTLKNDYNIASTARKRRWLDKKKISTEPKSKGFNNLRKIVMKYIRARKLQIFK